MFPLKCGIGLDPVNMIELRTIDVLIMLLLEVPCDAHTLNFVCNQLRP